MAWAEAFVISVLVGWHCWEKAWSIQENPDRSGRRHSSDQSAEFAFCVVCIVFFVLPVAGLTGLVSAAQLWEWVTK